MALRNPVRASGHRSASRPATEAELAWLDVLLELEAELEPQRAIDDDSGETIEHDNEHRSASDAAPAPYAGNGMWRSPAQMPPLPDSLRARAEALHLAQMQREHELRAERNQVQRQLEALSVVPRPRAAAASVYLDVVG